MYSNACMSAPRYSFQIGGGELNHDEDGKRVLHSDGHTEYQQNPFTGIALKSLAETRSDVTRNETTARRAATEQNLEGCSTATSKIAKPPRLPR